MTASFDPKGMTFEELLKLLDDTVSKLEMNDLPLDEAIATYERSVEIANACTERLDSAELRVSKIEAGASGLPTEHGEEDFNGESER